MVHFAQNFVTSEKKCVEVEPFFILSVQARAIKNYEAVKNRKTGH